MSARLPQSGKSIVVGSMVDAKWLAEQEQAVTVVAGGAEWLNGFYKRIHEGDLAAEDKTYLGELEEWNADEEDNAEPEEL